MQRWRRVLRIILGIGFIAKGVFDMVKRELMGDEVVPMHDHNDPREVHEAALSWARTIFSHAAHTHDDRGVTGEQVASLALASEELDNCFVAKAAGAVLLTTWLVQALAEATDTEPEALYAAITLQLARIGTVVPSVGE